METKPTLEELELAQTLAWEKYYAAKQSIEPLNQAWYAAMAATHEERVRQKILAEQAKEKENEV